MLDLIATKAHINSIRLTSVVKRSSTPFESLTTFICAKEQYKLKQIIGQGTILVYSKIDVDLCKERHKTHGRYYLIGLRQNTYKHTNPKKRDQRSTQ
ncbi:hypothetical protein AGMMS49921_09350 [Endomicrobiia bacterium]|nr:hypothetical protein AGMMS49921_09350 [Endomicrobiia bacterium]